LSKELDQVALITVIGRGHSGTRAMSQTLSASGVFMGSPLNRSGDLLPPGPMYEACRVLAEHVRWNGDLTWDWSQLHTMDIPRAFSELIETYLTTVQRSALPRRGWKIPETTLAYPWIRRMFPEAKYIFWIRNPRDCILGSHLTDDLRDFGIPYPATEDVRLRRAISWKYQYDLVRSTPLPGQWIEVRFEDFVQDQEATLARLEAFLGFSLARIKVNPDAVGRWQTDQEINYYDFLEPAMREYGYQIPPQSRTAAPEQQEITCSAPV
jgi:hypothetical protein